MAVKVYTKKYAGMLQNIFESQSYFLRAFGGEIQTIEGAEADNDFLNLKISDTDVVIQEYNTDENVAFGTGTGSSSRFGPRREIKSVDKQVPFDKPLAINEGVDIYTVNDIPEQIVAERLALNAVAWAEKYDEEMSKEIFDKKGVEIDYITNESSVDNYEKLNELALIKVFDDARKIFVNNKVSKNINWVAYVNQDVYSAILNSPLTTTGKRSSADIDNQSVLKFKGFIIVDVEDSTLEEGMAIYFVADNVGVAGIGIPLVRTIDEDVTFAGTTIQASGKLGKYIPDANKKAIVVAKSTVNFEA